MTRPCLLACQGPGIWPFLAGAWQPVREVCQPPGWTQGPRPRNAPSWRLASINQNEDLQAVLHGPKANTIMEGTTVQLTMLRGLTSDMAGTITAQIDIPVCDSITGDNMLIPQFSKVTGHYDNSISNGQERVGLLLDRIIFPDTSSIQLGGMEGADSPGMPASTIRSISIGRRSSLSATIIAIGGAAVQLAQPQQNAFSGISPGSTATGALTQQYSQLGQEAARQGMSIPNTLNIRPGYQFTIAIGKDIHLPVQGSCGGASPATARASAPNTFGPIIMR